MSLGYTMDQNYIPPMRMSQPASSSGAPAYSQTISSSPALYQSKTMPASSSSSRRHSELPNTNHLDPSYHQSYRRTSNPYDSTANGDYSMAPSQTIPSISGISHSQVPSPNIGVTSGPGMMPQYNTNVGRYVREHQVSTSGGAHRFTDHLIFTIPACIRNLTHPHLMQRNNMCPVKV